MANEKRRLIDAEPIKKFIVDGLNNPDLKKAFGHDAIEILTEIEYAPTVDAVPVVHGRWVEGHVVCDDKVIHHSIVCSVCNDVFKSKHRTTTQHWKEQFKMCPFCGARMDLEE